MNIVTVAEIKRNGFAVLEAALAKGVVHLMKRNRPSAVVLRPEDYNQLLLAQRTNSGAAQSALHLLLQPPAATSLPRTPLDAAGLRVRLAEINDGWSDR